MAILTKCLAVGCTGITAGLSAASLFGSQSTECGKREGFRFDFSGMGSQDTGLRAKVLVDDLVWHSPRPLAPRHGGWEDRFMRSWKEDNYDAAQRLRCENTEDSPYDHHLLCNFPAYVPARLPLPPQSQLIPRVIFVSWITRRLGRSMFASLMNILQHNPEYELVFFTDDDVDRFVCENYPGIIPNFSVLRAGAARIDVWRMMVMQRYGGVYLDFDMSSIGHLPIAQDSEGVSGLACWSHLPTPEGGNFEHWALAFKPGHPLITATLEIIERNLRNPNSTEVAGAEAVAAEASYVMRLTGPVPYERALHRLLHQAKCKVVDSSYCPALQKPHTLCDYPAFHAIFGKLVLTGLDLNNTITKDLYYNLNEWSILQHKINYDDEAVVPADTSPPDFCSKKSLDSRKRELELLWVEESKKKNQ